MPARMSLNDAGGQDADLAVSAQDVEMMHRIPEAVVIPKLLGRRAHLQVERLAGLMVIADRLHADFGYRLLDRLGVIEASLVLDFEDHRSFPHGWVINSRQKTQ